MKRLSAQCSVLVLVLTLALSAFAKPKSENITLYHDASVNGTSLPAGNYVVKYDVEGTSVQLKFFQGSKEVASTTGHVKTLPKTVNSNQVVVNNEGHGIAEIDFAGKDSAITFELSGATSGE